MIDNKYVQKLIDGFNKRYGREDEVIRRAFERFPENRDPSEVLMKILLLDRFYSTRIPRKDLLVLTEHILHVPDVDGRLKSGECGVVEDIGKTPQEIKKAFVFASKYCNFHNPTKFPIFDSFSRRALCLLNQEDPFTEPITESKLQKYSIYCKTLKAFLKENQLNYSYKEIDQFLWLYGKKLDSKGETR